MYETTKMTIILVIIAAIALTNALEPLNIIQLGNEKSREVIGKYMQKIPDIKEQLVIDERLSKAISHYFKGKISAFPLYKVSVTIDRNPVKIPWSLDEPNGEQLNIPRTLNKPEEPTINKENGKQDVDITSEKNEKTAEEIVQSNTTTVNKNENTQQNETTWETIEKTVETIVPKKNTPKKVKKIYKMIRPTKRAETKKNTTTPDIKVETTTDALPILTSSSIKTTSE